MRVYRDDQKFLNFRINVLLWANVIVFVFLAGSFWFVQGLQADKYRVLSEANALREIVTPAKRGLIMDRNGKILADNQPSYSLSIDRVLLKSLVKADANHKAKLFAFVGEIIGKRGVELMYDNYLRGKDGAQYWEYDSKGRRLGEYRPSRKEPVAGDNIYLSVDFELQRRAEQYFIENEFVGAAVALDPRNGEVLAMVSSPEFNPNVYSKRFTPEVWKTIASNPFKVELNRAIQGLYSPGSVFKAVMAMAGLTDGVIATGTSFYCGGSAVFFGRRFRCDARNGHGEISVANALKVSCDIFFF